MSKMDLCTCEIMLSGDKRTIIARGPTRPMSWPEINLMMYVHGERNVTNLKVVGEVETDNSTELETLKLKYGSQAEAAFPGSRPKLPMEAPDDIPRDIVLDEYGALLDPYSQPYHAAEPLKTEGMQKTNYRKAPDKADSSPQRRKPATKVA